MSNDFVKLKHVGHYLWGIDTVFIKDFILSNFYCVGHYLWGIDTPLAEENHFRSMSHLAGRTLPMRNWYNMQLRQWDHQKLQVSDITYEELIHHLMMVYSSLLQLLQSDITYEELIHFRQQQSHLPETLKKSRRTLPMRNWYTPVCIAKFAVQYMHRLSDITYEELIQTWKSNT